MMIVKPHNKGFSLLEMLLTVIIFSGILLAVFNTLQNYAEKTLARSVSDFVGEIDLAVNDLLSDPNEFMSIYNVVAAAPDGIIDVSLSDLIDGTGVVSAPVNNLNSEFQNATPWKVGFNIMLRAADDLSDANDTPAIEVIIATNQRVDNRRVNLAATYSNAKGGFYRGRDLDNTASTTVRSAFSTWEFDVSNLSGTPWAATVSGNPPSFDNGIYYVHYSHYNFDDISGDYLYRTNVAGRPELNTMHADLDLGQNDILGADDLDPQSINVSGQAIISGSANIVGNTNLTGGNFETNNTMRVNNNATIRGIAGGSTGNFVNQGNITVDDQSTFRNRVSSTDATFNGNLTTTSNIIANNMTVSGETVSRDTFADTLDNVAGNRPSLNTRRFNTSNIETNRFNANGAGDFGAIDIRVNRNANITNEVSVREDLTIFTLQTDTFGACDNGC